MKSTTTVADVLRSSVASATHAFLSAEPHIRSTGDPNRIHDARAAIRRLRSDLRVFKRFLDPAGLRTCAPNWAGSPKRSARCAIRTS